MSNGSNRMPGTEQVSNRDGQIISEERGQSLGQREVVNKALHDISISLALILTK